VPSVGPSSSGQQSRAALCYRVQHAVPAQGVKGVLPVHLHSYKDRVGGAAGPEGVPDNLAASRNADGNLQRRQVAASVGTCGQGTQRCKPIPYFPDCNGADTTRWLFEGKEAGIKEAGEMGNVAADHRLHKA
jgi:hypothetical protein